LESFLGLGAGDLEAVDRDAPGGEALVEHPVPELLLAPPRRILHQRSAVVEQQRAGTRSR
jgi:hypothetical protein